MKKILVIAVMTCTMASYSFQELSRGLFAYNYHAKKLQDTWYSDRIGRPAFYAVILGITSLLSTLHILHKYICPDDDISDLFGASGIIGACTFFPAWVSLILFKGAFRLFKKNADEESLKQSLAVIALKLKTAIADGSITLEELECCCFDNDCPLVAELVQYARAYRYQL